MKSSKPNYTRYSWRSAKGILTAATLRAPEERQEVGIRRGSEKLKLRHLRKGSSPAAARIREGVELLLQLSENDKAHSTAAGGRNCCSREGVFLDRTTSGQEVTGKQKENTRDETSPFFFLQPHSLPQLPLLQSLTGSHRPSRNAEQNIEDRVWD